jgi:hypothetical protein
MWDYEGGALVGILKMIVLPLIYLEVLTTEVSGTSSLVPAEFGDKHLGGGV